QVGHPQLSSRGVQVKPKYSDSSIQVMPAEDRTIELKDTACEPVELLESVQAYDPAELERVRHTLDAIREILNSPMAADVTIGSPYERRLKVEHSREDLEGWPNLSADKGEGTASKAIHGGRVIEVQISRETDE